MGTSPDLCKMGRPLTPLRSQQLRRIKKFFKVQTAKSYISSAGKKKCVRAPNIVSRTAFHNFGFTDRTMWLRQVARILNLRKFTRELWVYTSGSWATVRYNCLSSSIVDTFFCFALSPCFDVLLTTLIHMWGRWSLEETTEETCCGGVHRVWWRAWISGLWWWVWR